MRACSQLCIACDSIAQGALEFVATVALAVSATAAVAVVQDGATTLFLSTDAVVLAGQRPRASEFEKWAKRSERDSNNIGVARGDQVRRWTGSIVVESVGVLNHVIFVLYSVQS